MTGNRTLRQQEQYQHLNKFWIIRHSSRLKENNFFGTLNFKLTTFYCKWKLSLWSMRKKLSYKWNTTPTLKVFTYCNFISVVSRLIKTSLDKSANQYIQNNNLDISVGKVTGYRLDSHIWFLAWAIVFYHHVQIGCKAHPTFYPRGTQDSFHMQKAAKGWMPKYEDNQWSPLCCKSSWGGA
jgi:hypothetical protein